MKEVELKGHLHVKMKEKEEKEMYKLIEEIEELGIDTDKSKLTKLGHKAIKEIVEIIKAGELDTRTVGSLITVKEYLKP